MRLGAFDEKPATVDLIDDYLAQNGLSVEKPRIHRDGSSESGYFCISTAIKIPASVLIARVLFTSMCRNEKTSTTTTGANVK